MNMTAYEDEDEVQQQRKTNMQEEGGDQSR